MGTRDKRVDAYIAKSAGFAKPVLTFIREVVHEGCPEVEETIKWSHVSFQHKGIVCGVAAFKEHCTLHFWKHDLVVDSADRSDEAADQVGRITKVSDLPPRKKLVAYVKKAKELNEKGVKVAKAPSKSKPAIEPPADLLAALKKNRKALATFENFSPSNKREYVQWIVDAKTDETRQRRLTQAVEWMADGKPRNWKYM
ncbi:MAG TPA: YdeI/OmpD-associated family protein [Gemmatimonadaceae bacterium]|nr:YdeI/OmpD-associated family protein [Gemmatimonadaceae bacterium]